MDKFSTCSDDENNAAAVFSFYQLSSLSPALMAMIGKSNQQVCDKKCS
jgi:uncharacterized BrkB/YihY/UPF0761 family membrane protein